MADKMLDRVSKLLRQAEGAEEGSPEREAFMEKAMVLSQAHSIDLAIARAHQAKKERVEVPEKREYKVGETGGKRSQRSKDSHFVDLLLAIGRANDLSGALISRNRVWVWMTGMPSDHEMTERMFTLLSVQMVHEADSALKAGANKRIERRPVTRRVEIPEADRAWGKPDTFKDGKTFEFYYDFPSDVYRDETLPLGKEEGQRDHPDNIRGGGEIWDENYYDEVGPRWRKFRIPPTHRLEYVLDADGNRTYEDKQVSREDGRIWRANFYKAFVETIEGRLRRAKRQALREAGIDLATDQSEKGIALRDKAKEVQDTVESDQDYVLATKRVEKSGGGYGGAQTSRTDWHARDKGEAAAHGAAIGNEKDLREA